MASEHSESSPVQTTLGPARCVLIAGLIGWVGGCQPAGSLRLLQPQLQGWQRELKLDSEQVRWAGAGDANVERFLAEFPLPGARTGRPTYLLYLRLPAGKSTVDFAADAPDRGRGFFIQTRGEYSGIARLAGGAVDVRGSSTADDAKRHLTLDLVLDDGSRIVGELQATRDEYFVSRFETRRHPADVKTLTAPPVAPGPPSGD